MKNKPFAKLILVSQFGITTVGSLLICVFVSIWIRHVLDAGYWVVALGIILGALSIFNSFYRLYRRYKKEEKEDEYPPGSNDHL